MGAPPGTIALDVAPCTLAEAKAFVGAVHRHHDEPTGHKFSVRVIDDQGTTRGVAVAGRPVARRSDNGRTCEITRCATDGTPNACSMLYGACCRTAKGMGYRLAITYTLPEESGASLRAAGFVCVGTTPGRSWDVPSRRRKDRHPLGPKLRWERAL